MGYLDDELLEVLFGGIPFGTVNANDSEVRTHIIADNTVRRARSSEPRANFPAERLGRTPAPHTTISIAPFSSVRIGLKEAWTKCSVSLSSESSYLTASVPTFRQISSWRLSPPSEDGPAMIFFGSRAHVVGVVARTRNLGQTWKV